MAELPKTLEDAVIQAIGATTAAIADGQTRLQVDLLFPELKFMPVAEQFIPGFESYGDKLKVLFADAGASALARRDWGSVAYQIQDIGTGRAASLESKIQPEDEIFLFIAPTVQEVPQLEQLTKIIDPRPFVMLNPRLEDSGTVGIGYAARQTRERFINTIESCYYLRPIYEEAAVFRCYPGMWEVWVQNNGSYEKVAELPQRPTGEEIDTILAKGQPTTTSNGETAPARKPSMLRGLQRFLKALSS